MNQKEWKNNLEKRLRQIGIACPKSISIYQEAFTHKSYANENNLKYNQQRLEFLGDSAIGWIISNYLYGIKPKIDEGKMTITKSRLVCKETLSQASKELKLQDLLWLGKGFKKEDLTDKVLEDTFESFVGAIVQDQGIKKAINLINSTLIKYHRDNLIQLGKDYKTTFQEIIQSTSNTNNQQIKYLHSSKGDIKVSKLYYSDSLFGVGEARNFKEADQLAAKNAIEKCQFKK